MCELRQIRNRPSLDDIRLPFGKYPIQRGTKATIGEIISRRGSRKIPYLMCHVWDKLAEVFHRLVHVNHMGPFSFLDTSPTYLTMCRGYRNKMCTLYTPISMAGSNKDQYFLTDAGSSSSISETPRTAPPEPSERDS